ncbi:SRPBCC family protein, partial [Streptomyces zhihengii]|uniref:SRPBCC family protein n=2 Tax=Streptomyces zhihengii TaxID=1818004 RepID=UPI00339FB42D
MSMVTESIEVDVPVSTAYNQWTQFEEFPRFMEGVERVEQLDARHNRWTMELGGITREFDTEIIDQLADERIAWRTTRGETKQKGMVSFQRLDESHTRVELVMDVEAKDIAEKAAAVTGLIERRVKGDMRRFKEYIEGRGGESGAWRGRVTPGFEASSVAL